MTSALVLVGRRTSLLASLALLAAGLTTIFANDTSWIGSWKMALDWGTGSVVLIGPLAAGWAAFTYATLTRRQWAEFAAGVVRLRRAWLDPALTIDIAAAAALAMTTAAAIAVSSLAGSRASPSSLWVIGEAVGVVTADVGIGAVLGVALRGPWAAPLAALAVFVLGPLSALGYLPGLFDTGSASGSLVGQTWSSSVLAEQGLVAVGLAVVAIGLLYAMAAPRNDWLLRSSAAVGGLCVVCGWVLLESGGHERYALEGEAPEWSCLGEVPQVCLNAETTRPLAALSLELHRQAAALRAVGADLPARFDQLTPGWPPNPRHGVIAFVSNGETGTTVDLSTVSRALATPAWCPQFAGPTPPIRALRARVVLADWIATRSGATEAGAAFGRAEQSWLGRDGPAHERWVIDTYTRLRSCDLNAVAPPF